MSREEFIERMHTAMCWARQYDVEDTTPKYWIGQAYDALQEGGTAMPTGGDRDLGETEELIEWAKRRIEHSNRCLMWRESDEPRKEEEGRVIRNHREVIERLQHLAYWRGQLECNRDFVDHLKNSPTDSK